MGLEDFCLGNEAFSKFSVVFCDEWEAFDSKDELLGLVKGDIELARPIASRVGKRYREWLLNAVPALDQQTPLECLSTATGIRKLKTCIMRMP
ncbi:MAG: DUF2384 domain-containing protein [Rhodocyclaceae bacterium]|nr:MAG: DUF2384 domain-containing protein [Rhodocyclaceae bacterium]